MNRSVIVHGPQGCGKTRNAVALARHFGLSQILDDQDPYRLPVGVSVGCLILTNHHLGTVREHAHCDVVAYAAAARAAGVNNHLN
ncbi:hypothetical protein [Pseudoxanthomonas winnipegensis]|uniref:ATPase AAA-type core domain-containing protein n=1 Tax=Pseudoxanthomonas winnipegensis TaxID=2480810 RepID=A0A4Q8M8L6_9GAMM|nr:hypothetical protein [Pseudoxanthomonas winnipegensis]TAA45677.1 hypothetical protein EA655_05695 [Pseudoxanthomonas winnipegensis]